MKSETNFPAVSQSPDGGGTSPAAFADALPQSGKSLSNERVESQSLGVSKEGDGSLKAAPSNKRVIKRPGARVSYANLNRIILKQLYRKTEIARTLGWSVTTFERVADGLGIKPTYGVNRDRYLGRNVVAALEGGSR